MRDPQRTPILGDTLLVEYPDSEKLTPELADLPNPYVTFAIKTKFPLSTITPYYLDTIST